jgi:nucleoside-diphosphate-sugar epimerase
MRVFVTGATGFIGSAIVPELIAAGHKVTGLARNDAAAAALERAGAAALRGSLEEADSLARGAANADGVIHAGFVHDFSKFAENCETDRRAIEALGAALKESDRPLLVTSGVAVVKKGPIAAEDDDAVPFTAAYPRQSEATALKLAADGVNAQVVRLPPSVHGAGDKAFVPMLIKLAREKGVSAYVGAGENRWPAVHRLDCAHLYRLVLEKGSRGARYHAVAEEGVPVGEIAGAIGRGLKLPTVSLSAEQARDHFGWLGFFLGLDLPASSKLTQQRLGWRPTEAGLMDDLDHARDLEPENAKIDGHRYSASK